MKFDTVILGSGPAGLAAALYLGRMGKKILVVQGIPGGQMSEISELENYPGSAGKISGIELSDVMKAQAIEFGAEFKSGLATGIEKNDKGFEITLNTGEKIESVKVIVATGASPKRLGIQGEDKFVGSGVSFCATCDGNFYRGMKVAVVGGGNSALSEALHLSHLADSVKIIYRGAEFKRAEKVLIDRANEKENIEVVFKAELEEIIGDKFVEEVKLKSGETLKIDGVFIAIGHSPNTEFLKNSKTLNVPIDEKGHIITVPNKTKVEGEQIFACGDVRAESLKQVVIAAGQGATAAMESL